MTLPQNPLSEALLAASPASPVGRRWSWHTVARIAWIVLALVLLGYFVASIPAYYQSLHLVCTVSCTSEQLTPGNLQALTRLHLSVAAYAGYTGALTVAVCLLFWVVGGLIFWRTSREWRSLFVSLTFVLFGATQTIISTEQTLLLPQLLLTLTYTALIAFALTFPTGRFTPRWTWAVFVYCVVTIAFTILLSVVNLPAAITVAANLSAVVALVGVQVYRYVRVYNAVQRQQTKWLVFAAGVGMTFILIYGLAALVPGLGAPDSWYQLLKGTIWPLFHALIPLGVGIAILRYRLWDIDLLINRTLVYGSLTALLVALYVGLILALQALVRAVTGNLSQPPLVIVASTLVIAALFQPLRHRIQDVIDRRFYRRKYDAAKVVEAFSATLRDEVDLDQLREQLLAVVQETMQPTQVSLWVCQPSRAETSSLQTGKSPPEDTGVRE